MLYKPDAVERALVAAGYVPRRAADGHFFAVLKQDLSTNTFIELHVEPRQEVCLMIIRYVRRLSGGPRERIAIHVIAADLGRLMRERNDGYTVTWGYAANTNSATVDVETSIDIDETLVEAINRLLVRSVRLFDELESAGRILC